MKEASLLLIIRYFLTEYEDHKKQYTKPFDKKNSLTLTFQLLFPTVELGILCRPDGSEMSQDLHKLSKVDSVICAVHKE